MGAVKASDVKQLLSEQVFISDGEAEKSRELTLSLLSWSPAPFSRSVFTPGHVTCTGVVLSPDRHQVLLVHHRRLDRWLLPGGHVELEDLVASDTARREVIEETGANLDPAVRPTLVGCDVHAIPARGREPLHLHHDLIFGFQARSQQFECSAESRAVVWRSVAQLSDLPMSIRRSVARMLNHPSETRLRACLS
jgi:8-oxo-dGTP pyrophosphatase MutT (NUDIX family)